MQESKWLSGGYSSLKPALVVLFGDTHCGSTTAISTQIVSQDKAGDYKASAAQIWLYRRWLELWEAVKTRAVGHRLIAVHMGDVVDGDHHHTVQALPNIVDQESLAIALLTPIRSIADKFYIIRGTEAHAGNAANSEVRIAHELGADGCEWEMRLDVDGVIYDLGHHGRVGGRPWTSGGAGVVAEVVMESFKHGLEPPRFVVRAHRHTIDDSGERNPKCRAFTTPAWQLRTAFGYKASPNTRSDIGGVIVEGERVDFIRYYAAERTKTWRA